MIISRTILESEVLPKFWRVWKREPTALYYYMAPIPLCWLFRLAWNMWCLTYYFKSNCTERLLDHAHQAGLSEGGKARYSTLEGSLDMENQGKAKSYEELEARVMSPFEPKSEELHWAKRRIEELLKLCAESVIDEPNGARGGRKKGQKNAEKEIN